MNVKTLLRILAAGVLALLCAAPAAAVSPARETGDSIRISLITCWPGREVYELCGHEAVRVRTAGTDSVWNYGTFDFNAPNFIYRFVKGETDYMLSSYPFAWFMPEYIGAGRRVVEQELNLTPDEARRFLDLLRKEALPANRTYRYNYVRDNCATRIVERLDEALGEKAVYTDSIHYGTFRREMRAFHGDYPWYQFGIDLALGSGLARPLRGREEMFVPLDMMRRVASARRSDGRPLCSKTTVLNEGVADATAGPTPRLLTPMAVALAALALTIILCVAELRRRRAITWWRVVYFTMCGLAGCLLCFLVFVSEHEATSPNILIIWLNPLQLITAIVFTTRRMQPVRTAMSFYNVVAVGALLLVWPFQPQSANPAFFPLMGCAVALGASYAIIRGRAGYNNSGRRTVAAKPRGANPRSPRKAVGKSK